MKEKRFFESADVSLRTLEEDGKRYFTGYAAVFNKRSKLIAERGKVFYEYIERNAFDDVLANDNLNCVLTFNHKRDAILGRTSSGTLTLGVDDVGLHFKSEVPNTTLGNDTYEMVKRGDYPECSFVFTVKKNRWERDVEGNALHYVERVAGLYDVAIVVDGAYGETTVSAEYARAIEQLEEDKKEEVEEIDVTTLDAEYESGRMIIDILKLKK